MIKDQTLDEAIVEAMRFVKAAKALRAKRKQTDSVKQCLQPLCFAVNHAGADKCTRCGHSNFGRPVRDDFKEHAACKRASLDLTRKLADLRAGR